MQTKQQIKDKYNIIYAKRQMEITRLTKDINQMLSFMEYTISKDFQSFNLLSFAICGSSRRNFGISREFQSAFSACTPLEKVQYYEAAIKVLTQQNVESIKNLDEDWRLSEIEARAIKGIKMKGTIKILFKQQVLNCGHFQIKLSSYLFRKSKKDRNVFCLETVVTQEPTTIRLEILDNNPLKEQCLLKMSQILFEQYVGEIVKRQSPKKQPEIKLHKAKSPAPSQRDKSQAKILRPETIHEDQVHDNPKSLIEQLVGNQADLDHQQEIYEYLQRKVEEAKKQMENKYGKLHKNRLSLLLPPNYSLNDLYAFNDYVPEIKIPEKRLYIYYCKKTNSFKLELTVKSDKQKVLKHLCQGQNEKLWNGTINQSQAKWAITSQNACIFYRKQKSISDWFRERDFLFIRYLFSHQVSHFIIDRSIQNPHFIPFQSIQRAYIHHCIYKVQQSVEGVSILIDFKAQYEGLLTQEQKKNLSLSYLKQYANFQQFINTFKGIQINTYDLQWQIEEDIKNFNNQSFVSISSIVFEEPIQGLNNDDYDQQSFYSIVDQPVQFQLTQEEHDVKEKRKIKEILDFGNEEIKLNSQGLVILPSEYLRVIHTNIPVTSKEKRMKMNYDHIMLKNDFKIDSKGGIVLTNQTKIKAQNNVIKFIMSTLKKNLFSGKGILNISLPVQIFSTYSNLQKLCEAMSLSPDFIERRALKTSDPLERFRQCIAFGFSNSIVYFDIQKAFNPILGQTYQGFIDGCPIYGEQISHHPPISSLLLIGRGYKVHANIEAKAFIHLNSGEGVNQGTYHIQFDDGGKVHFETAPGEVLGLAVGDRKYRIKGKMIVVDPKNRLCCIINFEDQSGLFSSNKWKYSDQMQGNIWKVSSNYIRNYYMNQNKREVIIPSKKDIQQTLGEISGRWTDSLIIDGREYYNTLKDIPHQMVHYQFPLPSNSNYREDLLYRKFDNLARSQQEKERLEIIQRTDRKFREKYHPAKH